MIITRNLVTADGDPILDLISETGSTIRIIEHAGERHAWLRRLGGPAVEIPADPISIRNHTTGL
jgi:hypothetical protein